jgi:hypothetical protein
MEDVKNNPFSIMGCSNADLPLGGCSANIQRRLPSRKNGACKNNRESVVGSRSTNGDPDCHGFSLSGVELSRESLGKHHRSHNLSRFQSHWVAWIPFRLRQILDNCRTWVQPPHCLVCMGSGPVRPNNTRTYSGFGTIRGLELRPPDLI